MLKSFSESKCFIIIPVHNRKQTTLLCLKTLKEQNVFSMCSVVVVDDGSTDGTQDEISALFPEVVVLRGDGNLWWTGAIKKGMQYAYENHASHFIWLNDDTLPSPKSISLLMEICFRSCDSIVSAQCYQSSDFNLPTYGGQVKRGLSVNLIFVPPGRRFRCDCLSGNLVCMPCSVIDKVGYPPVEELPHCLADIVYTWRARKSGYVLEVLGDATAVCEFNPLEAGWLTSPIPMFERWKMIRSIKSNINPPFYWKYCREFYGLMAFIPFLKVYFNLIIITLLHVLLPFSFLIKIKTFKDKLLKQYVYRVPR